MIGGILADICRHAYLPFVINRYLTIVARLDHPPIVLHQRSIFLMRQCALDFLAELHYYLTIKGLRTYQIHRQRQQFELLARSGASLTLKEVVDAHKNRVKSKQKMQKFKT
jgi:hypothetical protein